MSKSKTKPGQSEEAPMLGDLVARVAAAGDTRMKQPVKRPKVYKLYVWEDVLCDYYSGRMYAIATTVKEARAAILNNPEARYHDGVPMEHVVADLRKTPHVYKLDKAVGFLSFGGG